MWRSGKKPGFETRGLDGVKLYRAMVWASVSQIDHAWKMVQVSKRVTGAERQGVLAQRERCLQEGRESAEHLRSAVDAFREILDKNQVRDLDGLQRELSDSSEAARRSEARMRELQREGRVQSG